MISKSLSVDERRSLRASFHRGGWNDLMMRNTCDLVLDRIKKETGVDFLDIRTRVILGKSVLMHVTLWEYINKSFDGIEWEHISYIFDGVVAEDYDTDYVKLVLYQPQE